MGKGVRGHRAQKLVYAGLILVLLLSMVGLSACGPGQPAPEEPAAPAAEAEPAEEPGEMELEVPQTTLNVTIEPPDAGTVDVSPEAESYPQGMPVTLEAVPAEGYEFDRWSGNASDSTPTIEVIMGETSMEVTAHFKAK